MKSTLFLTFVMASLFVMCGGNAADTLDAHARFDQLSGGQLKLLCDWLAASFGGYGNSIGCDGAGPGGGDAPHDQASCVTVYLEGQATHSDCPLTVGQFKECITFQLQSMCLPTSPTNPEACVVQLSPPCSR
jgi:hypothetical protein